MALDANYIKEHFQGLAHIKPEFGYAVAKLILEQAIQRLGAGTAETVAVPITFTVAEMKPQQCVEILVNGVHVGHIGI